MSEIAQGFAWSTAAMKADTALMAAAIGGVWQGFAPLGTTMPYGLVVSQSAMDVLTENAKRLMTDLLFQIKAVGPASTYSALVTIADRIDALFGRTGVTSLSPGYVLASYREEAISYEEDINGIQISHLGGLYRIALQGS